jgi:hypothetical protein
VKELTLWTTHLSNNGLLSLRNGFTATLTSLSLNRVTSEGKCEDALIQFLETAPLLSQISLIHVSAICDQVFEAFTRLPNVWKMVHVECDNRTALSTAVLVSFLKSAAARELGTLTVDGSEAVTDVLLHCLAKAACRKHLETLSIVDSCVTVEGLIGLVESCPKLGLLDVNSDEEDGQVTDKFIDFLIQSTHCLYYVSCCGRSSISLNSAAAFARRYPDATLCSNYSDEELGIVKPNCRPGPTLTSLPEDPDK